MLSEAGKLSSGQLYNPVSAYTLMTASFGAFVALYGPACFQQ